MEATTSFFTTNGTATFPSQATAAETRLYLGSYASAPTVDLAGDPLQSGMLYANTVDGNLYLYDGTSWSVTSADTGLTDVVQDLSPQLGGDLQSNSFDIVLADDDYLKLGTDADTLLSHRSAQNKTWVQSDGLEVRNKAGSNLTVDIRPGATKSTVLYHQGAEKMAVRAGGILVTGGMTSDTATIASISYPTSDGTNGQVMTTDGAGNLTLQDAGGASVGSAIAFAIAL